MRRHIPFAKDANGQTVSIEQVPSGLACRCRCAGCNEPLIAKKGKLRRHYFAHESGSDCVSGYESAIHLAVKTVLEQTKQLRVPACYVWHRRVGEEVRATYVDYNPRTFFPDRFLFEEEYGASGIGILPSRLLSFDRIAVEQTEGDVRPDLIGYIKDVPLFVEVAVTSFVHAVKMEKLRARGVSVLELDFSKHQELTWEPIERELLTDTENKKWLINRIADQRAAADLLDCEKRIEEALARQGGPATHESIFITGNGCSMRVFMCKEFLGVHARGGLPDSVANKTFYDFVKGKKWKYDKLNNVWWTPSPSEELFLAAEERLRRLFKIKLTRWKVNFPPEDDERLKAILGWRYIP